MKNRKSFLKGALCGALAMLLAAGLVSCGLKVNSGSSDITSKTEDKISELQNLVKKHYMGDVKEKNLEDGIYKGYINGLNDPYSVYYNKKETKELYESTGGEYSGIGAVMSQNTETGVITLVQIYKDSPAEKAGLKDNDILYKVEGKEVTGKDLSKVVSKIKGEKGTTVELTVLRGENAEEVTVTATRDTVQAQTIEYKLMDDKIGYIRVSEFDTVTYDQYKEALDDLEKQGMTGLVVDLRNNPGGSLSTVCDMLDLMLPKGLIVYTEDKDGKKTEWTFSKKCHCNTDLYIFSICDRTVWIVGCCKTGICVPWICSIHHFVYSIYHPCDRDKRKRDLKFIFLGKNL